MTATREVVPSLHGPIPVTAESHQFNSTLTYDVALDLGRFGFVEEEFFVSATSAVYADDLSVISEVPYTNRLIVRRPANPATASGVVFVEILNPSNGYDAEGMWRRGWDYYLDQRHTYVGISARPVTIDALKIFDPLRYAPLSWDLDPQNPHKPVGADANPYGVVDGCEEGIVWDIITQTGRLLRDPVGAAILGDLTLRSLVLTGQSQSAQYLNTWLRFFHPLTPGLWDGFCCSVGSILERPLRQEPVSECGLYAVVQRDEAAPVSVPTLTVTCEGDVKMYGGIGVTNVATAGIADGPLRRHWCVSGAGHTEVTTPVMPGNPEVVRAGRKPRLMTSEQVAAGNIFPLQPAVTAALDAVVAWATVGKPAADSVFFETDTDGNLVRDDDGNVRGGLRYGLIVHPVATFTGSPSGGTLGSLDLFSADRVLRSWPSLASYLAAVAAVDRELESRGYLNDIGFAQMQDAARELWTRATGRDS